MEDGPRLAYRGDKPCAEWLLFVGAPGTGLNRFYGVYSGKMFRTSSVQGGRGDVHGCFKNC